MVVAVAGEVMMDEEGLGPQTPFRVKVLVVAPGGRGVSPRTVYALNGSKGLVEETVGGGGQVCNLHTLCFSQLCS